jgi:hypothetical protein
VSRHGDEGQDRVRADETTAFERVVLWRSSFLYPHRPTTTARVRLWLAPSPNPPPLDAVAATRLAAHWNAGKRKIMKDAWKGIVVKKTRGLLDGSNMYRRLKIRLNDGTTMRVRVERALWDRVTVGDTILKEPGKNPVRG